MARDSKVGVWTMMSVDPELGYIYMPLNTMPLNTAAPDYYGGHRPGRNPQIPQGLPLFKPPYSRLYPGFPTNEMP